MKDCEFLSRRGFCFLARLFCFSLFLLIFQSNFAFSQNTISVIGKGITKEEAIQDALRSAVEKATGVFVYSITDVENFKVVKDKVVAASKGYVKDYKITDEKSFENLIVLTVDVTVDVESIKNIIHENIKAVTYDDVLKDYALITQKMDRLKKSAELLKEITSRPATEMYSFDYVGYEVKDVGLKEIKGNFLVRVGMNPFFWDTYEKILEQINDKNENFGVCGLYSLYKFFDAGSSDFLGSRYISFADFKIHKDLSEFLIKPRSTSFKVSYENSQENMTVCFFLFKNLVIGWDWEKIWEEKEDYQSKFKGYNYIVPECKLSKLSEYEEYVMEDKSTPVCITNSSLFDQDTLSVRFVYFDSYMKPDSKQLFLYGRVNYQYAVDIKRGVILRVPFSSQDTEIIKSFNKIKLEVTE